jgi:3-hydroxyisobutyrate dehydrogenase-like beta-hydroxyacid dehydrogenase
MAARLEAAGFTVLGYDIDPAKRMGADSADEVARACRRILISLPTSDIAERVLAALPLAPGAVVIDTTTGEPETMAAMGAGLAAAGVDYLDATIGGSSRVVRNGEAIVMAGGRREAFDACTDLFRCFAARIFYLGPCGAGARMKLVVNLVLGLNRAVLAEGLSFARACGVDPAEALEVLKAGPAHSRAMDAKGEKMLAGDFTVEARLSQHLKDVRLILAAGAAHGACTPLSEAHRALLERAEAAGYGDADNSAVIKAFA